MFLVPLVQAGPPMALYVALAVAGVVAARAAVWLLEVVSDAATPGVVVLVLCLMGGWLVPSAAMNTGLLVERDFGQVASRSVAAERAEETLGVRVDFDSDLRVGQPAVATTRWTGHVAECTFTVEPVETVDGSPSGRVAMDCPRGRPE